MRKAIVLIQLSALGVCVVFFRIYKTQCLDLDITSSGPDLSVVTSIRS